jgi:hypothetical protein
MPIVFALWASEAAIHEAREVMQIKNVAAGIVRAEDAYR